MLINEHKLNMMNVDDRKYLEEQMVNFLFEGKEVEIEGYVPQRRRIIKGAQRRLLVLLLNTFNH